MSTNCEQVTQYLGNEYYTRGIVGMTVITPCQQGAEFKVEWGERDMTPSEMYMCGYCKDAFIEEEAAGNPNITWTYVRTIDEPDDIAHSGELSTYTEAV